MFSRTENVGVPECKPRVRYALLNTVLDRLSSRGRLNEISIELFHAIQASRSDQILEIPEYVGDEKKGSLCHGAADPKSDIVFECSKNDFNCVANFNCAEVFGDCGGAPDSFQCKNDYDCKDFFDCWDYGCGDPTGGIGAFNCDTSVDFLCGGTSFECHDDFDCSAGHVFNCFDKNNCVDNFECKATGDTSCNEPGGYPYATPDGGGTDTVPGDFRCGVSETGGGSFDCNNLFQCTAKDEFDCIGSTEFTCKVDFDCGKDTNFECDHILTFTCQSQVDCLGTYTTPSGS